MLHQNMRLIVSSIFLAGFSHLPLTVANSLAGCDTVHCPVTTNGVDCQVSNETLQMVGITTYSVPNLPSNPTISWTVGTHVFDAAFESTSNNRLVERAFYLGTPQTLNLTDGKASQNGCAIYFTGPSNTNIFYNDNLLDDKESHCDVLLGPNCGAALSTALSALAKGSNNTCSVLASKLSTQIPSECTGLNSAEVFGVSLVGQQPIDNSTSNCSPTLPQSNTLTRIVSYNISATDFVTNLTASVEGETPLLSVFWNESATIEPDVQFSCLRPIDLDDQSAASLNNGSSENPHSGATVVSGYYGATLVAAAIISSVLNFL